MKLLHKVPTIEIKRCFAVGDICAHRSHRGHMKKVESEAHFKARLESVKNKVLSMNEKQLDAIVGKWHKRLKAYNSMTWYAAEATPKELGVWSHAGELPLRWTNKSLAETAIKVKRALARKNGFRHPHIRARHAVRGILATSINVIQNEKYLLPIVFKTDTGTRGRARLKTKMKGDIDDGCMRSVALAVSGVENIKIYFGKGSR